MNENDRTIAILDKYRNYTPEQLDQRLIELNRQTLFVFKRLWGRGKSKARENLIERIHNRPLYKELHEINGEINSVVRRIQINEGLQGIDPDDLPYKHMKQ